MFTAWTGPLGVLLLLVGAACDPPRLPARAELAEPQYLTFRCVREEGRRLEGVPIDGCGCTDRVEDADGNVSFRELGQVECTCTDYDDAEGQPISVEYVTADQDSCRTVVSKSGKRSWTCEPARDPQTGGWEPATEAATPVYPAKPTVVPCVPRGGGELRGYVGATRRGEVAVLDLTNDERIEDIDKTIPGSTAIYVGDLITDVATHPDGDYVFTVNSTHGSASVIVDDQEVRVAHEIELAPYTLFEAVVHPSPALAHVGGDGGPPRAYVSAPLQGRILELDLDALGRAGQGEGGDVVLREIELDPAAAGEIPVRPGPMAVSADGRRLYVAHLDQPQVSIVDLAGTAAQKVVDLAPEPCADGYLVDVVDLREARICANGADDDGDGFTDEDDPECRDDGVWEEAVVPECPQVAECRNRVDDDADGLIDDADPDCADSPRWERPVPACADGEDNDGDGVADRADPDCADELDGSEAGRELSTCANGLDDDADGRTDGDDPQCRGDGTLRAGLPEETGDFALPGDLPAAAEAGDEPPCRNAVDDDGDGLIDGLDPGCRDYDATSRFAFEALPECGDGVDNDRDGRADFVGGDTPDCYAASDNNEGSNGVALGPTALASVTYELGDAAGEALYAVERRSGALFAVDLGADGAAEPVAERIVLPAEVQAITVRQTAADTSVLLVDGDGTLRSVEITAPVPVRDQAGRPVYARLGGVGDDIEVTGYYVVEDEEAYEVPELGGRVGDLCDVYAASGDDPDDTCTARERLQRGASPGQLPLALPSPVVISRAGDDSKAPQKVPVIVARQTAFDRGVLDPAVVLAGRRRILNDQTNILTTAFARTNRVSDVPQLFIQDSGTQFDPARHPAFCRDYDPVVDGELRQAESCTSDAACDAGNICRLPPAVEGEAAAPGLCVPSCVPIGRTAGGRAEATRTARERTRHRLGTYEGIRVIEEDPLRIQSERFTLAYEAVLPGSESRSGQFGNSRDATEWSLVDYDKDFCRLGVEVGDVVVIERFVQRDIPVDAASAAICEELRTKADTAGDRRRFREPLRYVVEARTAHLLSLRVGDSLSGDAPDRAVDGYEPQLPRDPNTLLPVLQAAPRAPVHACATDFIRYAVRVGNDQWLLTGERSGHRHAWFNRDGICEEHPRRRAERWKGRVLPVRTRDGVAFDYAPFENEWFRFRLGYLSAPENSGGTSVGIAPGRMPHMLDARYQFTLLPGLLNRSLSGLAAVPREMQWLPVDDRLYMVDSAQQTVLEVTGLDPYITLFQLVRRFN